MDNLWIVYLQIPESGGGPRISRNFPEFANFEFLQIFVFFCKISIFCKFSCFCAIIPPREQFSKNAILFKNRGPPPEIIKFASKPLSDNGLQLFPQFIPKLGSPVDKAPNMW